MRYSILLLAALMLTGVARSADSDADTCRMPGDIDRRIAACTRVVDDNGLSAEARALALTSRGFAREGNGDVKGAMADYNEAIRLDPRSANARLFRSSLFRNAANYDHAIEDLSEAIRIDPGVALFYTQLLCGLQRTRHRRLHRGDPDRAARAARLYRPGAGIPVPRRPRPRHRRFQRIPAPQPGELQRLLRAWQFVSRKGQS
jgi:tetratricopeptide (TPR) repeat protein